VEERFGLFGGVEVEVDDDVARVVDGALQAVPAYSGLFPTPLTLGVSDLLPLW